MLVHKINSPLNFWPFSLHVGKKYEKFSPTFLFLVSPKNLNETFLRGGHVNLRVVYLDVELGKPPKKKVKKLHNKCELSPKMENPSPYFTTILADFGT